jgi:hypothetical protein
MTLRNGVYANFHCPKQLFCIGAGLIGRYVAMITESDSTRPPVLSVLRVNHLLSGLEGRDTKSRDVVVP